MSPRVRISRVVVQLEAFVDDGGPNLRPLEVQPVAYAADDWTQFDLDEVRDQIQRQVDEQYGATDNVTDMSAAS